MISMSAQRARENVQAIMGQWRLAREAVVKSGVSDVDADRMTDKLLGSGSITYALIGYWPGEVPEPVCHRYSYDNCVAELNKWKTARPEVHFCIEAVLGEF